MRWCGEVKTVADDLHSMRQPSPTWIRTVVASLALSPRHTTTADCARFAKLLLRGRANGIRGRVAHQVTRYRGTGGGAVLCFSLLNLATRWH